MAQPSAGRSLSRAEIARMCGGPKPPACGGPQFWQTCVRSAGFDPNEFAF